MPEGLERRVNSYLANYLSEKPKGSRWSSYTSINTDESLFEQSEPLVHSTTDLEFVLWRKSLQMRQEQQAWQVNMLLAHYFTF